MFILICFTIFCAIILCRIEIEEDGSKEIEMGMAKMRRCPFSIYKNILVYDWMLSHTLVLMLVTDPGLSVR